MNDPLVGPIVEPGKLTLGKVAVRPTAEHYSDPMTVKRISGPDARRVDIDVTAEDNCGDWPQLIERIRTEHNGVFGVDLFFGHDGHNACSFRNYERVIVTGISGRSMQEAVERCIVQWQTLRAAGATSEAEA